MVTWYIDSSKMEEKYLKVVNENVSTCMDYFCNRLSEIEFSDLSDLKRIFKEVIEELPILSFHLIDDNDFYFRYNSYTLIKFNEPFKSIKREIVLKNILA